jgi:sugar transferase (PEP-CTERM/EpsH1 system associated)
VSPIKVLHILHAFSHGGLENGIVNIINGSPQDITHELCILSSAGEFLGKIRNPIQCHELHRSPGNGAGLVLQLNRIMRQSGADIVHTRNWGAFDGVLAALFNPKVKLLHGEHGREMTDHQGLNARRNRIRRALSFRIKKFTTVSQDLSSWLINTVGIPAKKVLVIPNGVDACRYRPYRDSALRDEFGIGADDFVVGTIGRLDPIKNHKGLIRAFTIAARQVPRMRLVIVGDGPERSQLEALISSPEGIPTPILTGYRSDVERFYGIFDLFVLNSYAEGMSNTLLEAMASQLPIICTPVGANVDLIHDGKQGRYVGIGNDDELAQAILGYCLSQELRFRHSMQARLRVEAGFTLSSMVESYVGLYRSLIHG